MNLPDEISRWIKKQVDEAGVSGVVLGLSGGIDSAVVACLAKKALGDNVLGLIMPCESNPEDERQSRQLAERFNIKTEKIDLTPIYESFLETIPSGNRLAEANLKPRLRMLTLYYFANNLNYLVAGTGNKTEICIGYFTKYGDGGVDILPLGNLLKSGVRKLAEELGIPETIITRAPSAGLWEGQTDEAEIGITYEELDKAITAIETGDKKGVAPEVITKVENLINSSTHKRTEIAIFKVRLGEKRVV